MKTREQLWLASFLSELLNMQSLHELLSFAFCILEGIRAGPHFILYHISIVYQAEVGNNFFLFSPLPLEISIFATISRTAAPAIVYQGGARSPPSPRALPN